MFKIKKIEKKCSNLYLSFFLGKRKAQTLSLSTVVIAALVLLVLVVLSIVFASRMGFWTKSLSNCDTVCVERSADCDDEGYIIPQPIDKCDDGNTKLEGSGFCCRSKK